MIIIFSALISLKAQNTAREKHSEMDKIFTIAKSVKANTIQKMNYNGKDVYIIINTFYELNGTPVFKILPDKTYEPPIDKDKLKPTLGKWIKNKNGNYTALR